MKKKVDVDYILISAFPLRLLFPRISRGNGNLVQYMNKFKLDKKALGNMLANRFMSMIKSLNYYIGSTTYLEPLPVDAIQIDQLQKTTIEFNIRLEMIQQNIDVVLDKLYEQLRHHLETNNIMSTLDYNGQG